MKSGSQGICNMLLKSGPRKGYQCGKDAKYIHDGYELCGIHMRPYIELSESESESEADIDEFSDGFQKLTLSGLYDVCNSHTNDRSYQELKSFIDKMDQKKMSKLTETNNLFFSFDKTKKRLLISDRRFTLAQY
jgi:hypothetical protein